MNEAQMDSVPSLMTKKGIVREVLLPIKFKGNRMILINIALVAATLVMRAALILWASVR